VGSHHLLGDRLAHNLEASTLMEKSHMQERMERALREETIEAMIERYKQYGMPIDQEGYLTGRQEES